MRKKGVSNMLHNREGKIYKTNDRIYREEIIVGYRGIKAGSSCNVRISVGCGTLICVKERVEGNGIPSEVWFWN